MMRLHTNSIRKAFDLTQKIIAYLLIVAMWLIRPLLGPMNICPYTIGCTQYAIQQLEEKSLYLALKNIFNRLIQCHPFGKRI